MTIRKIMDWVPRIIAAAWDCALIGDEVARVQFKRLVRYCLGLSDPGEESYAELYRAVKTTYQKGSVLDFGLVKLPVVHDEHADCLVPAFLNLLGPYLSPRRHCIWPNCEGTYEQFGLRVPRGGVVLDLGASIGVFSAFAAARGARVYAFEPVAEAREYLEQTVRLNRDCPGSIEIVPLAVMDSPGLVTMEIPRKDLGLGSGSAVLRFEVKDTVTVAGTSLDDWVDSSGLDRVDFIKVDIEGAERRFLRGAKRMLRKFKPQMAICTYHFLADLQVLTELVKDVDSAYEIHHNAIKMFAR